MSNVNPYEGALNRAEELMNDQSAEIKRLRAIIELKDKQITTYKELAEMWKKTARDMHDSLKGLGILP